MPWARSEKREARRKLGHVCGRRESSKEKARARRFKECEEGGVLKGRSVRSVKMKGSPIVGSGAEDIRASTCRSGGASPHLPYGRTGDLSSVGAVNSKDVDNGTATRHSWLKHSPNLMIDR